MWLDHLWCRWKLDRLVRTYPLLQQTLISWYRRVDIGQSRPEASDGRGHCRLLDMFVRGGGSGGVVCRSGASRPKQSCFACCCGCNVSPLLSVCGAVQLMMNQLHIHLYLWMRCRCGWIYFFQRDISEPSSCQGHGYHGLGHVSHLSHLPPSCNDGICKHWLEILSGK